MLTFFKKENRYIIVWNNNSLDKTQGQEMSSWWGPFSAMPSVSGGYLVPLLCLKDTLVGQVWTTFLDGWIYNFCIFVFMFNGAIITFLFTWGTNWLWYRFWAFRLLVKVKNMSIFLFYLDFLLTDAIKVNMAALEKGFMRTKWWPSKVSTQTKSFWATK